MAAFKCTCFLLLLMTISSTYGVDPVYRVCVKPGVGDCGQIDRTYKIQCKHNFHGIDCIHNIENGLTDFGRVTPEQALIAANFVKNVVVIGEARSEAYIDESRYSTVVLVKQDFTGGFSNLRGKKFCHPGFKYEENLPEMLLKEFERHVLKANNIDVCSAASDTVTEKELQAVHEFFGPSCRPGPWSLPVSLNEIFYKRYGKLCELCNSNTKCEIPSGTPPFTYALDCLMRVDGGDIALTSFSTVRDYFNITHNAGKKSLYKYLCTDGSTRSLDSPCFWSKQPWDLIIANKALAPDIKNLIQEKWLSNNIVMLPNMAAVSTSSLENIEALLKPVLLPGNTYNKVCIVQNEPLKEYIEAYMPKVDQNALCGQKIRWCTISDEEHDKCLWLAQASLISAIQPAIECVKSLNKISCLEDIQQNKVDVVTSDAHYGYLARKKALSPIAYPETHLKNVITTLLVIKAKDADKLQKFEDLRNKKACFPEYGGIEWIAFINAARKHNAISNTCDYGEALSSFVGDSCIPGAHDQVHEVSSSVDKDKLCKLCAPILTGTAKTCNADNSNQFYGTDGALKCLKDLGDFAVITKPDNFTIDQNEFRVICQDGKLAGNQGFNIEASCALSVTIDSEVVAKRKQPNKNADLEIVLPNFEDRFGRDPHKAFEIFNVFNNTYDLLFRDSTPGIAFTANSIYARNYISLFEHADECLKEKSPPEPTTLPPDGANALQIPIVTVITSLILLFVSKIVF